MKNKELQDIANILRRDSLISTTSASSGHPTSCLSCAEIISVLFFNEMSFNPKRPNNLDNDEFILSKGHAAPILYSALFHSKCIKDNLEDLRKLKSNLEGHPMPRSLPWIKTATGSLGQGLSVGVGMALAAKLQKRDFRVYALLGDSELTEGSIYEALQLIKKYSLNNLISIVDINRLGQTGETILGHDINSYKKRFEGFGFKVLTINGHNINQIKKAIKKSKKSLYPTIILAKTIKGKGVSFLEDKNGYHGKALSKEDLEKALKEIPNPKIPKVKIRAPLVKIIPKNKPHKVYLDHYDFSEEISIRKAYGKTLASLSFSDNLVLALDAEVSNSTYSEELKKVKPNQFIESYIAEQNMVGMAQGLSIKGYNVFASTFSAFLSRAHDQIRMASISNANISICGSHAGVSIGSDGASQMGLEDISLFRALPNSLIFYPSDAVSTQKLTLLSSKLSGIKYIRTTRNSLPVLYKNNEEFKIGEFKVLKHSKKDSAVLIGSGITTHEALKAYQELKKKRKNVAVIDLYCIKPFNHKKLIEFVKNHGKKIIIAEDHRKEGGIGEMICSGIVNSKIKIKHLAVEGIPHSGKPEELLRAHGIDSKGYIRSVEGKW